MFLTRQAQVEIEFVQEQLRVREAVEAATASYQPLVSKLSSCIGNASAVLALKTNFPAATAPISATPAMMNAAEYPCRSAMRPASKEPAPTKRS